MNKKDLIELRKSDLAKVFKDDLKKYLGYAYLRDQAYDGRNHAYSDNDYISYNNSYEEYRDKARNIEKKISSKIPDNITFKMVLLKYKKLVDEGTINDPISGAEQVGEKVHIGIIPPVGSKFTTTKYPDKTFQILNISDNIVTVTCLSDNKNYSFSAGQFQNARKAGKINFIESVNGKYNEELYSTLEVVNSIRNTSDCSDIPLEGNKSGYIDSDGKFIYIPDNGDHFNQLHILTKDDKLGYDITEDELIDALNKELWVKFNQGMRYVVIPTRGITKATLNSIYDLASMLKGLYISTYYNMDVPKSGKYESNPQKVLNIISNYYRSGLLESELRCFKCHKPIKLIESGKWLSTTSIQKNQTLYLNHYYCEHCKSDYVVKGSNTSGIYEVIRDNESLYESISFDKSTPYMLRNDGVLLTCGDAHPYIKYIAINPDKDELESLLNENFNYIDWFYNNTNSDEIKKDIIDLLSSVKSSDKFNLTETTQKNLDKYELNKVENPKLNDILAIFNELNDMTNQEFCRVRTSNMRWGGTSGDVYFRISSTDFNWFDLIWSIVNSNKNFVTSVTICTDPQSKGVLGYYNHKGTIIKDLPTEEFLTLSGNPVIESAYGTNLIESYGSIHPSHIHRIFTSKCLKYIKENFVSESKMKVLNEATRNELISKSRIDDRIRYDNRLKYRPVTFDGVNIRELFENDDLVFTTKVGDYTDILAVRGVLTEIKKLVKGKERCTYADVLKAINTCLDKDGIRMDCGCPDFTYRFKYYAYVGKYLYGEPGRAIEPPKITNPDHKGSMCKHLASLISRKEWVIKVAAAVNNYIRLHKPECYPYLDLRVPEDTKPVTSVDDTKVDVSDETTVDDTTVVDEPTAEEPKGSPVSSTPSYRTPINKDKGGEDNAT